MIPLMIVKIIFKKIYIYFQKLMCVLNESPDNE